MIWRCVSVESCKWFCQSNLKDSFIRLRMRLRSTAFLNFRFGHVNNAWTFECELSTFKNLNTIGYWNKLWPVVNSFKFNMGLWTKPKFFWKCISLNHIILFSWWSKQFYFILLSSDVVNLFLPLDLLLARTLLPFLDFIRDLKPCLLALFLREGWNVRFMIFYCLNSFF